MSQHRDREHVRDRLLRERDALIHLSRAQLDERQLEHLNEQLAYACARSPFYRRAHADGRLPARVDGLDALGALPFTGKEDLRAAYPFGFLAAPREDLIRYGESTGSTGAPTSAFMTYADWERGNVWVEAALQPHFGPGDMVFVAIPYELAFASYDVDRALEFTGATVVAVGTLNEVCPWERTLAMMRTLHPTSIVCAPTRALRVYDRLRDDGHDPAEVGLRTLFYIGETCSPAKLDKLARLWGVSLVTAYGTTETNSLGLPCAHGALHLAEDRYAFEVVEPRSGRPLPAGARGELVLTSLCAQAMPLVRYRTGDMVRVPCEPCACGLPLRRVEHFGRLNERFAWDGHEVLRMDLEQALLSVPGTGCYYVAGVRDGRLEVLLEIASGRPEAVLREARDRVAAECGVDARLARVDKRAVARAMDRMLKPGGVTLTAVETLQQEC